MAEELAPLDVSEVPELLDIARKVKETGQPRLLKSGGEELAIVTPVLPSRSATGRRKTGLIGDDDPLWNIVGMASSEGPTDVSENKHRYLAEAYAAKGK